MDEQEREISKTLKEFSAKLPHFPDGRIDYSTSNKAPVLTCFVRFNGRVLILKRSDKVRVYRGKWNAISGYLDEPKPLREKVSEELKEELGIAQRDIGDVKIGSTYELFDKDLGMIWIVHPVLVELKKEPKLRLDWEHVDFKWIKPEEIGDYDIVPGLDENLKRIIE